MIFLLKTVTDFIQTLRTLKRWWKCRDSAGWSRAAVSCSHVYDTLYKIGCFVAQRLLIWAVFNPKAAAACYFCLCFACSKQATVVSFWIQISQQVHQETTAGAHTDRSGNWETSYPHRPLVWKTWGGRKCYECAESRAGWESFSSAAEFLRCPPPCQQEQIQWTQAVHSGRTTLYD